MPDDILLAAIIGAHGLKGEVRLKLFCDTAEALSAYGALHTAKGGALTIASLRSGKPGEAIARFDGVADRNGAEALKGEQLFVARAALPEPDPNEYYLSDLVGLKVQDSTGELLGTVKALHNFGAGDVAEILFADGGTEFLPFTNASVPVVDIAGGFIVIVPPKHDENA